MQFTSRRPRRVLLDMTPLIDVVLMLVIFFMLTTSFVLAPGIKVDLPRATAVQQVNKTDTVVIITKDGTIYYQNERVDLQTLHTALVQTQRQHPGLRLIIKADKHAEHGRVVEVMDTAKSAGVARLAIATTPKQAAQQ